MTKPTPETLAMAGALVFVLCCAIIEAVASPVALWDDEQGGAS